VMRQLSSYSRAEWRAASTRAASTRTALTRAALTRAALLAVVVVDAFAVIALRPDWPQLARHVVHPYAWVSSDGTDRAAASLAGAAFWLIALWFGIGLLAALASAAPGIIGRLATRVTRWLLPAVLIRATAGVAGLAVLAAPVVASAASAPTTPAAPSSTAIAAPVWPTNHPTEPAPAWPITVTRSPGTGPAPGTGHAVTNPARAVTSAVASAGAADQAAPTQVVVQAGDSLWAISARSLGTNASPPRIAAEWPRWYAANRTEVGADPSYILPGQVLDAPASPESADQ
jgi:LysM repeat protein